MTYKEKYMQCETLLELEQMASTDIIMATMINTDRVPIIKKWVEYVANLKFKEE